MPGPKSLLAKRSRASSQTTDGLHGSSSSDDSESSESSSSSSSSASAVATSAAYSEPADSTQSPTKHYRTKRQRKASQRLQAECDVLGPDVTKTTSIVFFPVLTATGGSYLSDDPTSPDKSKRLIDRLPFNNTGTAPTIGRQLFDDSISDSATAARSQAAPAVARSSQDSAEQTVVTSSSTRSVVEADRNFYQQFNAMNQAIATARAAHKAQLLQLFTDALTVTSSSELVELAQRLVTVYENIVSDYTGLLITVCTLARENVDADLALVKYQLSTAKADAREMQTQFKLTIYCMSSTESSTNSSLQNFQQLCRQQQALLMPATSVTSSSVTSLSC